MFANRQSCAAQGLQDFARFEPIGLSCPAEIISRARQPNKFQAM
jgi:hypothetical protein